MDNLKIIELKAGILGQNDRDAAALRRELAEQGTFLVNVMSSPGSGKTTTLVSVIRALGKKYTIGVMEADIDSDVDARTILEAGAKSVQLHTGGMCHLDAEMTRQGVRALGQADMVFLENVGNLVCPAEYDTGAARNITILSIPEGDDKPAKYPLMYQVCDLVVVNKMDTAAYFDFDMERCTAAVHRQNPKAVILPISAKTGEGISALAQWLEEAYRSWKEEAHD